MDTDTYLDMDTFLDMDTSLEMHTSDAMDTSADDPDPLDEGDIDLLCAHYKNLSLEAFNKRRVSWADMVEKAEEEQESTTTTYDLSHDSSAMTLEPETYGSSPLKYPIDMTSDTALPPSEQETTQPECDQRSEEYFEPPSSDNDTNSNCTKSEPQPQNTQDAYRRRPVVLPRPRLAQVLNKGISKHTSLRALVLLRAAIQTGKHDLCTSGVYYGAGRLHSVRRWDYRLSYGIKQICEQEIWDLRTK